MERREPPAKTIAAALLESAERGGGGYTIHLDDGTTQLSHPELAERALLGARRLAAMGVEPGDRVGVLGPNRPEWIVWAFATWIAGAVLVPIQIPLRIRDPDAFRSQLQNLVRAGRCRRVLTERRLVPLLPADVAVPWEEAGDASAAEPALPEVDSPAVIQFTSGSTASPKGALLTHAAVAAQMDVLHGYRYSDGTPRDTLGWTPFFHDLGLFANLVRPAYTGCTSHHLPTESFAKDPARWLRLVEATRAPVTVGPAPAFGSALRVAGRRGEEIDLSSLEAAYFAAEGVDPAIARRMVETAQHFGFRPEALGATYGLAEAVMAVSYPYAGTGLNIDRVCLRQLTAEGLAVPTTTGRTRLVASAGKPHMELRIAGAEGVLPDRHVGEVQVRGRSLMSGYVGDGAPDPFVDGWLCTRDLGYLAGGELYVTGRAKDMMIAMGHNYYPEDFEWAAARVDGVRPGRCVAFSLGESEEAVVLIEAADGCDPAALRREVERTVKNAVGVAPHEVVVLPPGTVQKTTSGKLRRAAMREVYAGGELPALG